MARRINERPFATLMLGYWLPVVLYVALIFLLSAQQNLKPPGFPMSDKVSHLLEYGGLGVLLTRALLATRKGGSFLRLALVAMCLGIMIGTADELFQSTVPGRNSDVFDLMADTLGLGLAQVIVRTIVRT